MYIKLDCFDNLTYRTDGIFITQSEKVEIQVLLITIMDALWSKWMKSANGVCYWVIRLGLQLMILNKGILLTTV